MKKYHIEQCEDNKEYWGIVNDDGVVIVYCPGEEFTQKYCDYFNKSDDFKNITPEEYSKLWSSIPKG